MDRSELAKKLAAKAGLEEKQAVLFVDAFCQTLADYFQQGEKVVIAEFGSFVVRPDKTIQFNPSARLKELVD